MFSTAASNDCLHLAASKAVSSASSPATSMKKLAPWYVLGCAFKGLRR